MKMKLRLVQDWRNWWRWHSTKALVLLGLLPTIWLEMPAEWKAMLPASWLQSASFIIMLIGILLRMTKQKSLADQNTASGNEEINNSHQG